MRERCRAHGPRTALRAHRRPRDRDDDHEEARRPPRVSGDGHAEAGGRRRPLVRHGRGTAKVRDLRSDPHLNLAYYRDGSREWISVSGTATLTDDRAKIGELHAPDWKIWFPDEGDPRHGTADDPRLLLIGVQIHAAAFLEIDKPKPVVLYELVKGFLTDDTPDLGEVHRLER